MALSDRTKGTNEFLFRGVNQLSTTETVATPTTAGSNTSIVDARGLDEITFYFKNDSDDAVTIQVYASPDLAFTEGNNFQVGSDVNLTAGDSTAQYDFATLTNQHPYLRINVSTDSTNATVGGVQIWLRGVFKPT